MLLLSVAAMAQAVLTVGPSTLHVGDKALISYSDPTRAGQTITVNIVGGDIGLEGLVALVTIQLDQNGSGHSLWSVKDWGTAAFSAPGVLPFIRIIL
jgi:hypothetical protein